MAVRLAIQPPSHNSTASDATLDADALLFAELLEEFGILCGDDSDLAAIKRWIGPKLGLYGVKSFEATLTQLLQIAPEHLARDTRATNASPSPDALLGGSGTEDWCVPIGGFATSAARMRWSQVRKDAEVIAYPADGDFSQLLDRVFRPLAATSREIVYIDRYLGHELVELNPLRCRPRLDKVATFLFELLEAADEDCRLEVLTSFEKCLNREQVVMATDAVADAIAKAATTRKWSRRSGTIAIYATKNKLAVPHDRRFRFGRTVLNLASGHEVLPGGSNRTTMAGILTSAWRVTRSEEQTFRKLDSVVPAAPISLG